MVVDGRKEQTMLCTHWILTIMTGCPSLIDIPTNLVVSVP